MIISNDDVPKILLIKRAERADDPWSGQIAFPGGKAQQGDEGAKGTAVRETLEEVGINLEVAAEFLGYAEPVTTHTGKIEVVPCVFILKGASTVRTNEEATSHMWVDLSSLLSPSAKTVYKIEAGGRSVEMPAVTASDYVVWGLTYRILSMLLDFPKGPQDERDKTIDSPRRT